GRGLLNRVRRLTQVHLTLGLFYAWDVRPAIRARREQRRDDLISHLLDEGCSNAEGLGEGVTFGAAGVIPTREVITGAARHLATHDALRAAYTSGDESARLTILYEILRLEPVVANLARWTTAEVTISGAHGTVTIPAGAPVDIGIAAANIDPAVAGTEP